MIRIMSRIVVSLPVIVVVAFGSVRYLSAQQAGQPQSQEQGQLIPGCAVPKYFGRLVTVLGGNNSGLAGQAVFEAEDGTIRWVPMMFNTQTNIMQRPTNKALPANFPILPIYECAVGHVWQRP